MSDLTDEPTRGDNGIQPNEYLDLKRDLIAAVVKKDAAVAAVRVIMKRFKDAGADVDAIADLRKLARLNPDQRIAREKEMRKYAAWEGITLWQPGMPDDVGQDEMFDEPSREVQDKYQEALVHSSGYNARLAKGGRDLNPEMAGSSRYQMWDRGWLDCEGDLKAQGETAQVATTERRPRTGKADGTIKDGAEPEKPKRGKKAAAEPTVADELIDQIQSGETTPAAVH